MKRAMGQSVPKFLAILVMPLSLLAPKALAQACVDYADYMPWVAKNETVRGHTVTVAGEYAYVTSYTEGLQVVDVSDPLHPALVAHVATPESPNFDRVGDVVVDGRFAYLIAGRRFVIVRVGNPRNPKIVSELSLDEGPQAIAIRDQLAYVTFHTGGLYQSTGGLRTIDISNPNRPELIGYVELPGGGGPTPWPWSGTVTC